MGGVLRERFHLVQAHHAASPRGSVHADPLVYVVVARRPRTPVFRTDVFRSTPQEMEYAHQHAKFSSRINPICFEAVLGVRAQSSAITRPGGRRMKRLQAGWPDPGSQASSLVPCEPP